MTDSQKIADLMAAILPMVKIADAWELDGLDQSRPKDWNDSRESAVEVELFQGRGGRQLLTIGQCFEAKRVHDAILKEGMR